MPDFLKQSPIKVVSKTKFPENFNIIRNYLPKYADMLKDYIDPTKIIMINYHYAKKYIKPDGKIADFDDAKFGGVMQERSDKLDLLNEELAKMLPGCHVIKIMPEGLISNSNHKWGLHRLHFITEYYEYLLSAIKIIEMKLPKEVEAPMLDCLRKSYSTLLRKRYESALKEGEYTLKITAYLDKETITMSDKAVINYKASGGTEKYKFTSFYRLDGASKWTMISMRKGASSCSFIPESKGSYKVCIKVKDTNKIEKKQYFNLEVV